MMEKENTMDAVASWRLSLYALTVMAVEMLFVIAFNHGVLSFHSVIMLHMLLAVLMACFVWYMHNNRKNIGGHVLLLLTQTALGPLGSLTCFITFIAHRFYCWRRSGKTHEYSLLSMDEEVRESNKLYERIIFGLDNHSTTLNIEPFHDIFTYGTLAQKQIALMKITRYFRPQFSSVLLQALNDKEAAIRVQAATVIARIEREFMKKYLSLEKQLACNAGNIEMMGAFAALCDEYADSGLLDKDREQKSRAKAIAVYEQCILLAPHDNTLKIRLGRLYLLSHEHEKAVTMLKKSIDEGGLHSPSLALWYMEALFYRRAFARIRKLADVHRLEFDNREEDMGAKEVVSLFHSWNIGVPRESLFIGGYPATSCTNS